MPIRAIARSVGYGIPSGVPLSVVEGGGGDSGTWWNSADKAAEITLSDSDRVATRSTTNDVAWVSVRSVTSRSTGKRFARIACIEDGGLTGSMMGGVGTADADINSFPGAGPTSWSLQCNTSPVTGWANVVGTTYGGLSLTDASVDESMFVAVDFDAGKIWLGTENAGNTGIDWAGGGNPATGASPTYTFTPNTVLFLMAGLYSSSQELRLYSQTGEGLYTLPTGFVMWG